VRRKLHLSVARDRGCVVGTASGWQEQPALSGMPMACIAAPMPHRKPLQVDKRPILRYTIDNKRQGIGLGPFHIFTEVVVSW
jgi:hypothetical protein